MKDTYTFQSSSALFWCKKLWAWNKELLYFGTGTQSMASAFSWLTQVSGKGELWHDKWSIVAHGGMFWIQIQQNHAVMGNYDNSPLMFSPLPFLHDCQRMHYPWGRVQGFCSDKNWESSSTGEPLHRKFGQKDSDPRRISVMQKEKQRKWYKSG